ncbi:peptidase M48 family protein [Bordetella holmesii 41130]|nr:peptidase M48 family protein [Bordetella holmesii ATCC 51541]EWM48522.1 peptidase M48 family protein [Bordetella holmesii 41130]
MGAASSADLSPALERQLGEAIMAQGRRDPTYVNDPELAQYLTTMGRKLASHSPGGIPEVEMFGVRDPEINAFAMPGGFIGVNTGLIVSSSSESELAAVLAHEIGHVTQRHIARGMTQQNQSSVVMMASLAAALLAALAGGGGTWPWGWRHSDRPLRSIGNWVFRGTPNVRRIGPACRCSRAPAMTRPACRACSSG